VYVNSTYLDKYFYMSRFNTLMENHLNGTELTRIRIKHDPANGIGEMNDYVGYVLEEDGVGNVIAIVPSMGHEPQQLGPEQYSVDVCEDSLTDFKKHVVNYMMEMGYHDKVKQHIDVIINAKDISQIEQVAASCGCNGSMMLNIYRDFVSNGTV
jgi:hypothetical protein